MAHNGTKHALWRRTAHLRKKLMSVAPPSTWCDTDDGRAFLEMENIIEAEEVLDINALVEALITISVLDDILLTASNAVHAVTFLLDQIKLAKTGDAIVSLIECKVDTLVEVATKKAIDSLKEVVDSAAAELKTTSTAMAELATQLTAMTTSYRDVLRSSPLNPVVGTATLDIRVRVREGIKMRQMLIDAARAGGWERPAPRSQQCWSDRGHQQCTAGHGGCPRSPLH